MTETEVHVSTERSDVETAAHANRRTTATVAIVLAFAAGATDAFAFLQLSGIFTANMTGNLVLAGLVERPGYAQSIVGIIVAIAVFSASLLICFRAVPMNAGAARHALLPTVGLGGQLFVLCGWILLPDTSPIRLPVLVSCSAVAMAAQTALAKRIESASGVTTTYVTGTLTSLMADLADKRTQSISVRVGVIGALVCGAFADALLVGLAPIFGAILPILPTVIASTALWTKVRRNGSRSQPRGSRRGS